MARMTQTPRSDPPDSAGWDRCVSPVSFWLPDQIGPQAAWLEHAPFAFWLINTLRPRMLVELGTHGGFSYFVFCQAIQRLQLDTRCYAVDTWRGDEHAGFYGEEVFEEVRRYHDRRYASFSTLVRSTFDDAVANFQDGTVDLLHIDGRHFYEDVRHDFDTWRPKLSERSIVLFHDTNVRERGFGVSKLWAELRSAHRHFEFLHGSGLGALGVGDNLPHPVDTLFRAADDTAAASQIRAVYSRLGSVVSLELRTQHQGTELRQWEIEAAALRKDIVLRTEETERVRSRLTAQVADADALRAEAATLHAEIASGTLEAEAERRRWQTNVAALQQDLVSQRDETGRLRDHLTSRIADADALHAEVAALRVEGAALRAESTALHAEVASGTLAVEAERRRWQTDAAALQQELLSQRAETERLRDHLTARIADADALHAEAAVLRAEVAGRRVRAEALRRDRTAASAELHVMRISRSWRFTRPLRGFHAAVWRLFGLERGARSAPPDPVDAEPLESPPWLEGAFLDAYFRTAELRDPPLRARGATLPPPTLPSEVDWPMYADRAAAESVAAVVRASDLFDGHAYAARLGHPDTDPALHYVLVGEHLRLKPSDRFDPTYYRERYPDIARARVNGLAHYFSHGRQEGRRAVSVAAGFRYDRSRIDTGRDTILLIVHEASRTGAPILAYNIARRLRRTYNVVAVLLAGGELVPHFEESCSAVIGPLTYADWHPVEAKYLVAELTASYKVLLAIVNSIESRLVVPALAARLVPTVILVHEFASYTRPAGAMGQALDWSTQVVFSADLVADAARREHPTLTGRQIHVLRQGQCDLPPGRNGGPAARSVEDLAPVFRPAGAENALVVLGCGTVLFRKGIDLFLSCAAAVAAAHPKRPVRFVWVGQGYDPEKDATYSSYLADQIVHSGLEGVVAFVDEIPDLDPAYALADAFFVSSRLDPLPNVAIEAALRGLPVVCFEGGSGMAEVLGVDSIARRCVVPHLDAAAAARVIAEFADDEHARTEVGDATRRLARSAFDMDNYVSRIETLGHAAVGLMRQRAHDFETIQADSLFNEQVYVPPEHPSVTRDEAILGFLARWTAVGLSRRAASNGLFRRPCAGFHPQIYAHENAATYDAAAVNPLADFIRRGKPRGPWLSDLITPAPGREGERRRPGLRIGVHAHFYYPELADDFLRKLASNSRACDLLLSTDSEAKAERLRAATAGYQHGEVRIQVVPNRGRNLGPLLTHFADAVASDYDLIGHVHGKRSLLIADRALGETWREFLWQHLLGGLHPMMDVIVDRFDADDELGLVFAADPHLSDWDANLELATALAKRMGIEGPLPPFFDFPNGTMFWARPEALRPVFGLGLRWEDYPEEPVPLDGTMLHALERLLPLAGERAGFRFATTHVPTVTW
jgi:glycosyltransferase involved in cell wall biosynthesis/regulator of replication initiation timing